NGPCYLRLGKAGEPTVHQVRPEFRLGDAIWLRRGGDICLISTGGMLDTAAVVADALESRGHAISLISMHTVRPLDVDAVNSAATTTRCLVTLEEHSIVGGLGSAVAEVISELSAHAPLTRIGLPPAFTSAIGDQKYLKGLHGLDPGSVLLAIEPMLVQTLGLV